MWQEGTIHWAVTKGVIRPEQFPDRMSKVGGGSSLLFYMAESTTTNSDLLLWFPCTKGLSLFSN